MTMLRGETFKPIAENRDVYDRLYIEYCKLHDYFGRSENDVMKRLRALRSGLNVQQKEANVQC